MTGFLLKRISGIFLMLLGITFLTFITLSFLPGGPMAGLISDFNPKVSPETIEKYKTLYNLDEPVLVRYVKWVGGMAKLDFGISFKDNRPVIDIIWERLPRTVLLSFLSMAISFLLAIPIGIISAVKQNTWVDRFLTVFVFIGFSVPTYWVALLLINLVGIQLGWLPVTGYQSILADQMGWWEQRWDIARHLVMPVLVLGLTSLAGLSRYTRNGMLEVIRQDYIRAARAKGLKESKVIYVHALRNTILILITIVGLSIPGLISGSVIIETIFSYPGLGRLAWEAIISRNVPVIMATVTFGSVLTLLGNLIADIMYAYADPRIRYKS